MLSLTEVATPFHQSHTYQVQNLECLMWGLLKGVEFTVMLRKQMLLKAVAFICSNMSNMMSMFCKFIFNM